MIKKMENERNLNHFRGILCRFINNQLFLRIPLLRGDMDMQGKWLCGMMKRMARGVQPLICPIRDKIFVEMSVKRNRRNVY